ncbi:MAG: glycosyltransferase, partial [Chitinophagaceae bacterium]
LLDAMAILTAQPGKLENLKLLVAGEFYEDEKTYQQKIDDAGIRKDLLLKTGYIPEKSVRNFFCAADVVVQPYRHATQSGVTPLAYHFEKPMIVTNVGGLPLYVTHEEAGLICEPNPEAIAAAIRRYFELGEQHFIPHLRREKAKYSWVNLVKAIIDI